MQLKLDMSCHLLNVYAKFQIDISKHVEEKSGKRGQTDGRTDGKTDGRTLPWHNTSRFSNGRIKTYKRTGLPYYFLIYINYILSQTKIYQNGIQKLMAMHKFLLMANYHKIYDNHNGCNIQAQIPYNRTDVAVLFESYIANRKLVFLLI